MQEDDDKIEEPLVVLDDKISASLVRVEIFKSDQMPEYNMFESTLNSLYKIGDQLYQVILPS